MSSDENGKSQPAQAGPTVDPKWDSKPPQVSRSGEPKKAQELLRKWMMEDDDGEQKETLDALIEGLNETRKRQGERILFPEHLRGITW